MKEKGKKIVKISKMDGLRGLCNMYGIHDGAGQYKKNIRKKCNRKRTWKPEKWEFNQPWYNSHMKHSKKINRDGSGSNPHKPWNPPNFRENRQKWIPNPQERKQSRWNLL